MVKKIVSGVIAGILISLGGGVFLACENRYVGAALFSVRGENLLPLEAGALGGVLKGSLPALDVLVWTIFAAGLLLPELPRGALSFPRLLRALACGCAVLSLLGACLVGCFGAALTGELSWPFFSLVRNLVFFRSIERIEALVVALWILPDFLIVSLFLRGAARALALAPGRRWPLFAKKRFSLPLCAAAAVGFALLAAPDAQRLQLLSTRLIPAANLFFSLVFLPGVLAAGRLNGRI